VRFAWRDASCSGDERQQHGKQTISCSDQDMNHGFDSPIPNVSFVRSAWDLVIGSVQVRPSQPGVPREGDDPYAGWMPKESSLISSDLALTFSKNLLRDVKTFSIV